MIGTFALAGMATPVFAACTALGPTGNAETVDLSADLIATVASSQTCAVTTTLVVPSGYYGVYKADSRVFSDLADPAQAGTASLSGPGTAKGQTSTSSSGVVSDYSYYTGYYATGLVGVDTPFNGTATATSTGPADGSSNVTYEAIEFLVAYTTLAQQQDSLNQVGLQQLGLMTHLGAVSDLLTGGNLATEGENEIGLIAGKGSFAVGASGRYNLAEGFSILGGVSLVDLGVAGANATGVIGAAALRYVEPGAGEFRLMGEAGVSASMLQLSFSRTYANGFNTTAASGSGSGAEGAIYAKGGVLWQPDQQNDVLLTATLKQGALGIGSLIEGDSMADPNFFAATYSGTSTQTTTVKGGVDWTSRVATDIDLTASLAVGASFNSGASAAIFGIPGTVSGAPQSTVFAQYGLRLGWTPTDNTTLDAFVQGTTGTGIGTHALLGARARMQF
jgi:hypothetical protein